MFRFVETTRGRILFSDHFLSREEAVAIHAERVHALKRRGFLPHWKGDVALEPHLGREGAETVLLRGSESRTLRWEEEDAQP